MENPRKLELEHTIVDGIVWNRWRQGGVNHSCLKGYKFTQPSVNHSVKQLNIQYIMNEERNSGRGVSGWTTRLQSGVYRRLVGWPVEAIARTRYGGKEQVDARDGKWRKLFSTSTGWHQQKKCLICLQRSGFNLNWHTINNNLPWFAYPHYGCWECRVPVR